MPTPSPKTTGITAGALGLVLAIIMLFEGFVPRVYRDPIGIDTSCYGHVGPENTPGRTFTRDECKALLEADVQEAIDAVNRCIPGPKTDGQMASLVSFTFNVGGQRMCGSTLTRLANAGLWAQACAELDRWVYAGGRKLPGLVKRRAAERALCEGRS